jgi:hypothetical protein
VESRAAALTTSRSVARASQLPIRRRTTAAELASTDEH